jgi:hypothetical protein
MPTLLNKKRSAPTLRRPAAPALIFGDLWNYDPAPETADPKLKSRYELFIGGKFVAPASGKYFDSINPANEQKLAEIARANAADVAAAYRAAKKAYDQTWSRLPGRERAKYLFRIARLLQDRAREFAVAETMDGGKPIKESRDFVESLQLTWNPLTTQIESHDWQAELYSAVALFNRILHNLCSDVWTYIAFNFFKQIQKGHFGTTSVICASVSSMTMPNCFAMNHTALIRMMGRIAASSHDEGVALLCLFESQKQTARFPSRFSLTRRLGGYFSEVLTHG